jgi:hypothetical protein
MKAMNVEELLIFLNKKMCFVNFEIEFSSQNLVVFKSAYFDFSVYMFCIFSSLKSGDRKIIFDCHLKIFNEFNKPSTAVFISGKHDGECYSYSTAIMLFNNWIKKNPFTIVKFKPGQYQLLDPNGMDYIGEFVKLKDAKNTCDNNFVIR